MVWSWDSVCQKLDTFSVFDLFRTWCSTTPFLSIILQYRSICHEYCEIVWDTHLDSTPWCDNCVCVCGVLLVSHMTGWFVSTCENSAQLDQAVHEGQNLMYLIPKRMMADVSCKDPCTGRRVGTLHLTWHWLSRTIDVWQSSETDIIVLQNPFMSQGRPQHIQHLDSYAQATGDTTEVDLGWGLVLTFSGGKKSTQEVVPVA